MIRSYLNNVYGLLTGIMLYFQFLPFFKWKIIKGNKKSKLLLEQQIQLSLIYKICIGLMVVLLILKTAVLLIFILTKNLNSFYLSYFTNSPVGSTDLAQRKSVMMEGGITLILESIMIIILAFSIQFYRPIILSVNDVMFYKSRMEFLMSFVSPIFEACVFLMVAYMRNVFGFILAFFACLMSFCQIPSFDRHHKFKILTFSMFHIVSWAVFLGAKFFSTANLPAYFTNTLNLGSKPVRKYFGAYIPYTLNSFSNCNILDTANIEADFYFILSVLVFGYSSGYILYHLKLGSLADSDFNEEISKEIEWPPATTFKDAKNKELETQMKESYYINYFLKNISLIFNVDPKSAITDHYQLQVNFLKTVPYLDVAAIVKKFRLYGKYKKHTAAENFIFERRVFRKILEFIFETISSIFTISNVVYASLFGYIAFFFYFKNQNPSLFSFLSFIGIFLLGVCRFRTFIFYSQFLVGIPMILDFMLFYFANLPIDIAQCQNSPVLYCQTWFGMYFRMSMDPTLTKTGLFMEMLVKIALFQGIFFFYRMLKFTDELFVEKSDRDLNLEIEESFNRGNLPFIRILIIQIASKFYIICFILLLWIGTSQTTYTNMVLLLIAVVYMSKFKLVKSWWLIVYIIMNFIFIFAYFIDLFLTQQQKQSQIIILNLLGLPINTIQLANQSSNALAQQQTGNKLMVMILFICCLVQQIAGKNRYIKCYMIKLNKLKQESIFDRNSRALAYLNDWKLTLEMYFIKSYYKGGIWISYFINIYFPLFQSITLGRAVLLISILFTFIHHINTMRQAKQNGKLDLDATYKYWKVFLVIKVINLSLLIVGAFGLNQQVRNWLGIVKDSSDYQIINYIGIESLEPAIIQLIPPLQNCYQSSLIGPNKLRFYFIAECITFILVKISMKILNIQRIYHKELFGQIRTEASRSELREKRPRLWRIYRIYKLYITGSSIVDNKKTKKIFNNFSGFLARIYTSLIYFITLTISVFQNISLLMLVLLIFFLRYFINMNQLFLKYLTEEDVEKVIVIKFEYFREKYISETALRHEPGEIEKIRIGTNSVNNFKNGQFTDVYVRKKVQVNLFQLALRLRHEITKYDVSHKYRLFLASLIVTTSILILTYINALVQNVFYSNLQAAPYIKWLKIISTIFGFKYYLSPASCLANSLLSFVILFTVLSYDVYVIRVITSLEKDIELKLNDIEDRTHEFRRRDDRKTDNEAEGDLKDYKWNAGKHEEEMNNSEDADTNFIDLMPIKTGIDAFEDQFFKKGTEDIKLTDHPLILLDRQDRKEIKIRGLRKVENTELLIKFKDYVSIEELNLFEWNFYPFYTISQSSEEGKFNSTMINNNKNHFRQDESSSGSDAAPQGEEAEGDEEVKMMVDEKENQKYPDMMKRSNILTYYHHNVKKFLILQILNLILDIQQRLIGALFILIVLQKSTLLVVSVYWGYIIYFYTQQHDANQLKITNIFIAVITLLQYMIVLLQQQIPISKQGGLVDNQYMLIDAIWLILTNNDQLTTTYSWFFRAIGVIGLDNASLLYDSIPTVLFQVTIFYYDFFLLFCAENLETTLLRIKHEISFVLPHAIYKCSHEIDFNRWKDFFTKVLLSLQGVFVVRLIEIMICILLILNIFFASPIWNFMRLAVLFSLYSNVAFRSISVTDVQLVRQRLKKILLLGMVYLWIKVVIVNFLDVFMNQSQSNIGLGSLIVIGVGEKYILAIEFFLIEYVRSTYLDSNFQELANNLMVKKRIRSQLIGICMTYDNNEEKLMNYINEFSQRIKLEASLSDLYAVIETWQKGTKTMSKTEHLKLENDENEGESATKEKLQKLTQTATLKSKLVFQIYRYLYNLRNPFLFSNGLALYDYVLMRNKEIVNNKEIDIRSYLSGHFNVIENNLNHIKQVYEEYIEDTIRHEYNSVNRSDVMKRDLMKKEAREALESVQHVMNPAPAMSRLSMRPRVDMRLMLNMMKGDEPSTNKEGTKKEKNYNFKLLDLNTTMKGITEEDGVHVFFKMLVEYEMETKQFQKIKLKVILFLLAQVILSNWHYVCYFMMITYTFVNGGFIGFFYSSALIIFVLVEENMPGIIFWKICFFNTALGFSLKLMFTVFAGAMVQKDLMAGFLGTYIVNISWLVVGSSSYIYEIFIMIFIIIELVLIDELGFKPKGMIDYEDTNTTYVRMKINQIFNLRDLESFSIYDMYLNAMYQSIVNYQNKVERKIKAKNKKFMRTQKKKNIKSPLLKEDTSEQIQINEIVDYEKKRMVENSAKLLDETVSKIEKNIFIKSFGKFSKENMKSFRWQLFTVFNRKPGIDLSPLLNFLLIVILIYGMTFIDQMTGGTQTFVDQVVTASIVNQSLLLTLLLGIITIIVERMIFKNNPREWREYFNYEDSKKARPIDMEQLNFCLREELKKNQIAGKPNKQIKYEDLEYNDFAHSQYLLGLNGKSSGSNEVVVKKIHDDSYTKNPLWYRYIFLICVTITITFTVGIYFPIQYNSLRVTGGMFTFPSANNLPPPTSSFVYFQNYVLFQIFYGIFLIYLIVEALQIRLGEPINKGKRELLSRFNILYKVVNIVMRVIPFFFTIAIIIDFMLTTTSMDIWEWFKFESIYEQLYNDILEIKSREDIIPAIKLERTPKLGLGFILAFTQIFLLICPFIFFGKYGSEKNLVTGVNLTIDLRIANSLINLYTADSAKKITVISSSAYTRNFQNSNAPSSITGVSQSNVQLITFYSVSSRSFYINLAQLDNDLKSLIVPNQNVSLLLTLGYIQKSALTNTWKQFSKNFTLPQNQISSLTTLYSMLRNIASGNPFRTLNSFSNITLNFAPGVLVKIPNVGSPAFFPSVASSYFNLNATLSMVYTPQEYLLGNKDLRWNLFAQNNFSTDWGDKNSFFYLPIIDDTGSSFFSGITTNLTIITMYTTFIYVAGVAIGKIFKVMPESIWVQDIPKAEPLIKLCEAIAIARAEEDLDKEVQNYYKLLDLFRSPELVKMIGEEYNTFMVNHRNQLIKQQVWIVKRDMTLEEAKEKIKNSKNNQGKKKK